MNRDLYSDGASSATIFLTGVTGFLGGAFLSHLIESRFPGEVVCLVRAAGIEAARERLRLSLARFGHHSIPKWVSVLPGDVADEHWHTAPELLPVTHTLHLAASTSFGKEPSIYRVNVDGALSVARSMRGRNLERYLHTGTATICGARPPHIVHEDDYPHADALHLVEYTKSKAQAEQELISRYGDLPTVIARPSIVVGHRQLGCAPSGSIFWVLRAIEALRFLPWSRNNRVDVVPVDWVAGALAQLLLAPDLKYDRYHLSAGDISCVRWSELEAESARVFGGPAQDRYKTGSIGDLTRQRIREAIPECPPRYLRHALELYTRFCSLDLIFDNHRLLREGIAPPPRFTDYMRTCLESSPGSIYEQMRMDLEATPAPVEVPA